MARLSSGSIRRPWMVWAFLAPAMLVFVLVGFYPLLQTVIVSLTDARLGMPGEAQFVGLENYAKLLRDDEFWKALINTVIFTVASVSLEFLVGLAMAQIVHTRFRGRGFARTAMLVPWAIPTVVSARIWSYMLQDTYGVTNDILVTKLGLFDEKIAWLATPGLAMAGVIAVEVWKTSPFVALLLLAGLQLIDERMYQAAEVDGANKLQKFFYLTLPMLKPAILVALIFRTLDALRVFDAIWVMTRGEAGTEVLSSYNYRQMINYQELGFGSAISVAIFAVIAMFTAIYLITLRVERHT